MKRLIVYSIINVRYTYRLRYLIKGGLTALFLLKYIWRIYVVKRCPPLFPISMVNEENNKIMKKHFEPQSQRGFLFLDSQSSIHKKLFRFYISLRCVMINPQIKKKCNDCMKNRNKIEFNKISDCGLPITLFARPNCINLIKLYQVNTN